MENMGHKCTDCDFRSTRIEEVFAHMKKVHGINIAEKTHIPFKEAIFELAYGEDAISKGYKEDEVIARLTEISNRELALEEAYHELWQATENGTVAKDFFELREKIRNLLG